MKSFESNLIMRHVMWGFLLIFWGCGERKSETMEPNHPAYESIFNQMPTDSLLGIKPFSIQIGAWSDSRSVAEALSKLSKGGFQPYVIRHPNIVGKFIYRVRVGPFLSKSAAGIAMKRVQLLGFSNIFIKNHLSEIKATAQESAQSSESTTIENFKQLTYSADCGSLAWSPSGREIAFVREKEQVLGIYSIGTGGGSVSRIAEPAKGILLTSLFAWSDDGKKVAFVGEKYNRNFEWSQVLFVVGRNGINPQETLVLSEESLCFSAIRWSPDGNYIAVDLMNRDAASRKRRAALVLKSDRKVSYDRFFLHEPLGSSMGVGWKDDVNFIFLQEIDSDFFNGDTRTYRFISLNLATTSKKEESIIYTENEYVQVELLRNSNAVAMLERSPSSIFLSFFLFDGKQRHSLLEGMLEETAIVPFVKSRHESVCFLFDDGLWINTIEGRKAVVKVPSGMSHITVSPSGNSICFSMNKDVFLAALP